MRTSSPRSRVRRIATATALTVGMSAGALALTAGAEALPAECEFELVMASEVPNINHDMYDGTITIWGYSYLYRVSCGELAVVHVN